MRRKKDGLLRTINNYSVYQTLLRAVRECEVKTPVLLAPCGYGWFFEWFKRDGVQIVGVDIEPAKVQDALAKQTGAKVIQANILNLPFKDNEFDFVISNRFLLHFNDDFRAKAIKELARVTRRHLLVHYDYATSIRAFMRKLKSAKIEMRDFSQYEGYRVWKRPERRLRYTREMIVREGAVANLRVARLYFVSFLISERVYCLYEKS